MKERKILEFKEHCFPDTLSDNIPQIALRFATLYLFYPFLSCFFCIRFLFKNVIVCVIFRISIRTRNLRNLQFELSVYYCTLKPPKDITRLNTKFGFSVIHFIWNFPLLISFILQILIPQNSFNEIKSIPLVRCPIPPYVCI